MLFSLPGLRITLGRAGLDRVDLVPIVKYRFVRLPAGPGRRVWRQPTLRSVASFARPLLRTRVASTPVPLRFGEMTVVAKPVFEPGTS
ncbi:MAG: hypothetical protein WAL04_12980 [Acidimicrobiales bacterium]